MAGRARGMLQLLALFCVVATAQAQDTVSLGSVEVTTQKSRLSQTGRKTETLDSTLKAQFRLNSVGEALSATTPMFIKSYGPGGIATTAFRGGNASQTAVLWNGFNIQNAMLGQADLALLPSVLFEEIGVEYGGSSSLWGSGAVGGSIHLDSRIPFNAGFITSTSLGGGSFGLLNGSTRILFGGRRFVSSTKLYGLRSDNNFTYKDTLDNAEPNKKQQHAGYDFKGLMQEFKFLINSRQLLSIHAWANDNHRRLPDARLSALSKSYQLDQALRLTAQWNYVERKFKSTARLGYFNDRIDYTDSLISLFSKSKVQTLIGEVENYLDWGHAQQLHIGLNASSSFGTSGNYEGRQSTSRLSLMAGNRFVWMEGKLILAVAARAEYFSVGALPLTGNVATEYKLAKPLAVKFNVAKVYRQPTLNELYWVPNGNRNLKPEQGYTAEGELSYHKTINHLSVFVSGAAYSRSIDNWILWIPGPKASPMPVNLQQVWSRGTETTWRFGYRKNKWNLGVGCVTGYVLSTIVSNAQENGNTQNRQLVYTPRYTVNGNLMVGYNDLTLVFFQQYVGYRFTTSDNTQWLNPYYVSSLKCNYGLKLKTLRLVLFAGCNNLFGNSYSVVAGRPMPLTNYEFGITLQTKNKSNNNQ